MSAVRSVLVVGAGSAGLAAAILLAEAGVEVDVIEATQGPSVQGSGITLQGNALRILRRLGVWDRARPLGFPYDELALRAPDAHGTILLEMPDARTGGADLPASMGMYRPDLAVVLTERAVEVGAKIRYATTAEAIVGTDERDGQVSVTLDDGSVHTYDLVIGADGVRSRTRGQIGITSVAQPTGMGIWRVSGPRPASVFRTELYYGGPSYIAGYSPTGPDSLYAYLVEPWQDRSGLDDNERLAVMRELASAYHGPWDEILASLTAPDRVNYARFESHVLAAPWHRGRVVLIGDAAHCCPPTLAQGAAQALEDAAVLAELLLAATVVDEGLWSHFMARRFDRAAAVVTASVQLCDWLLARERGDVPGLMHRVAELVTTAP